MDDINQWIPAIVASGIGLFGAIVATLGLSKRGGREDRLSLSLVDLEERYNHAVALLKDLELYRGRMEPLSYDEQRARLEQEAVSAMRAWERKEKELRSGRDVKKTTADPVDKDDASFVIRFFRRHPELKGFVWGIGLACVGGGLYLSVQDEAKPRDNGQNNAPMAARPEQSAQAKEAQGRMGELLEILQKEPKNIEAMVELGRLLLRAQLINEARLVTERTLQLAPDHLEALTHQAVIKSAQGQNEAAFDGLNYVLERDPKFHQAWFFKGMLLMQTGKSDEMRASFEAYIKYAPPSPRRDRIKQMLAGQGMQMPNMAPGGRSASSASGTPPKVSAGTTRQEELKALIEKEPTNVAALVELGHLYLRVQNIPMAKVVTDKALELAPDNLEALTHAAVVKSGMGDQAGGLAGLDAVVAKEPSFYKAWFFRGMLSMQAGKGAQMKESFEAYIEHAPDSPRKERIKKMLAGGGIQMPRNLNDEE